MEEIKQRIKEHEGYRDTVYSDSLGFATIGYGHLVLPTDNFVEGVAYDKETLEEVFDNDFKIAVDSARDLLRNIEHNYIIFGVLVEMCFQLGKPKVSKFNKMFIALKEKNLDKASDEMINSRWHKQTPKRCESLANIMKNANK
jgi:GH24 family phage-related lysozyme (muramidase)|tara:strand:- start:1182 stop:1610 length:429 start_codon:yes stop_codon:yes gene_type:complete